MKASCGSCKLDIAQFVSVMWAPFTERKLRNQLSFLSSERCALHDAESDDFLYHVSAPQISFTDLAN